jgi:hypothetical protein
MEESDCPLEATTIRCVCGSRGGDHGAVVSAAPQIRSGRTIGATRGSSVRQLTPRINDRVSPSGGSLLSSRLESREFCWQHGWSEPSA